MRVQQIVWVQEGMAEMQPFNLRMPRDNEILVKSRFSLISPATERAFFLSMPNAVQEFPVRSPGYSNVGRIMRLGPKGKGLNVGQRVAYPAGHRSHFIIDASQCLVLPDAVSEEDAVFFNLIAISMQGVRKARIELGEPVVIIGAESSGCSRCNCPSFREP